MTRRSSPRDPLGGIALYDGPLDALSRGPRDRPRLFVTPNLDHWRLLHRSRALRRAYRAAAVTLNDSRFLRRFLWRRDLPTLPGADLALRWLEAAAPGSGVLVVGCPPGVEAFVRGLRPDLVVRAVEPSLGYIAKRHERRAIARLAAELRPERIFVCTGAPQSELVAHGLLRALDHPCDILCCGAGLQFAAGLKRRAPALFQKLGVEWAWRMLKEPHTRMRYLRDAAFLATHAARLRRLAPSRLNRSPASGAASRPPRMGPAGPGSGGKAAAA